MRALFTICLLVIQLAGWFTADAGTPVRTNEGTHQKQAALYKAAFSQGDAAEVSPIIQFNCVAVSARDHRDTEAIIALTHQSNYKDDDLRKRTNVFPIAHWSPLLRLILFPNHYFW